MRGRWTATDEVRKNAWESVSTRARAGSLLLLASLVASCCLCIVEIFSGTLHEGERNRFLVSAVTSLGVAGAKAKPKAKAPEAWRAKNVRSFGPLQVT